MPHFKTFRTGPDTASRFYIEVDAGDGDAPYSCEGRIPKTEKECVDAVMRIPSGWQVEAIWRRDYDGCVSDVTNDIEAAVNDRLSSERIAAE